MSDTIEMKMVRLNKMYKEQDGLYRAYAVKKGLSITNFWILYALFTFEQPISQHDICNTWFYSKQTINSSINHLIEDGYLVLVPVEGARNKKNVVLTEKGLDFCQVNLTPLLQAEQNSLAQLSEEEQEAYLSLFAKQIQQFKEALNTI